MKMINENRESVIVAIGPTVSVKDFLWKVSDQSDQVKTILPKKEGVKYQELAKQLPFPNHRKTSIEWFKKSKLMVVLNLTSIQRVLRRHGHGDSWRGVCCPVISDDHLELFSFYGSWNFLTFYMDLKTNILAQIMWKTRWKTPRKKNNRLTMIAISEQLYELYV